MKNYWHISVFKISVFLLFSFIFKYPLIYLLCFLYLLSNEKGDAYAYLLFLLFINFFSLHFDLLPIGIVEGVKNDCIIVDKLLYKVKVLTGDYQYGDIVAFKGFHAERCLDNDLKNNIIYCYCGDSVKLFSFLPRILVNDLIGRCDEEFASLCRQLFYGHYDDYSRMYSLSISLSSYYGVRYLLKKNEKLGCLFMFFYSIFFQFDFRFLLLLIDYAFNKENSRERLGIKILFVLLLNGYLVYNNRIIFTLFIGFMRIIDMDIDIKAMLAGFQSIIFGCYDLFSIFLFKYLLLFRIVLFFVALLGLFVQPFSYIAMFLARSVDKAFDVFSLEIRGSISLLSIVLFLLARKVIPLKMDIVLVSILILLPFNHPIGSIAFIDVGQGDAALINCPFSACHILIDTGSSFNYSKLKKSLNREGVYQLDKVIISHDDSDHNGSLDAIIQDFDVKEIIDKPTSFELGGIVFDNVFLGEFDNDNDNSLVYLVKYNDLNFLFCGDISSNVESLIVKRYGYLRFDVLKVSHHGSKTATSPYFIGKFKPRFSVISTSGQYGHPSISTIETLDKYRSKIYSTKESGNIVFYLSNVFKLLKTTTGEFVIIRS